MKDATEQRTGTVIVRRARPVVIRPLTTVTPREALAQEFRVLRRQLAGATPDRRAELIRLLNENLRRQQVVDAHAPFFDPSRLPLPGEEIH